MRGVWIVKAQDGGGGRGGERAEGEMVVWYSGDDPGCIASRMPHLDYNIGRRFTRIWIFGGGSAIPRCAHQAISATVKLEDTLRACLLTLQVANAV